MSAIAVRLKIVTAKAYRPLLAVLDSESQTENVSTLKMYESSLRERNILGARRCLYV